MHINILIFFTLRRGSREYSFFFFLSISFGLSLSLSCRRTYFALSRFAYIILLLLLFAFFQISDKKNCSIDFSSNVPTVACALHNQGETEEEGSLSRGCMCMYMCAYVHVYMCVCVCTCARVRTMSHVQLCGTIEATQQIIYESATLFFLFFT